MKDLKHLYYFENLLQEVNNDLVREATNEGRIAVGSVCSLIPEVLLNQAAFRYVYAHRVPDPLRWAPTI
jgi:hypothetical protein